jgi:hypothetical protein
MTDASDLATAILAVYQAPLEEFVSRRDALAKELRAAKRRDDAALVKTLRKPSRIAWSLDAVMREDPSSVEQLEAAIHDAQTGDELRTALESVKEAVRAVAAAGSRVAVRAGRPVDPNALAMAVHAIIGDATAFAEMRAGRLVDVPEGGGLDLLSALTARPAPARSTEREAPAKPASRAAASRAEEPPKPDPRVELRAAARAELKRAEKRVAEMRAESEHAAKAVRDATAKLHVAERALAQAQAEVETQRQAVERSQRHADLAAEKLDDAQRSVDEAQARVAKLD